MNYIRKIFERSISILYYTILFLFMLSICSCFYMHRKKDGPPHFYVDTRKIANATPKPEPLSKYGNKSYHVRGKYYRVLKTSKHYTAVGVASWYGTQFHQQLTSSGERYNMLAMTAAHKTLPLPTYVEVMNLRNHRKIIVKINDRGPFKSNRLIDLSYVAAKKLDMIRHGITMVKITAINPYIRKWNGYKWGKPIPSLWTQSNKTNRPLHRAYG